MEVETTKIYRLDKEKIESILESWIRTSEDDYADNVSIEWGADMGVAITTSDSVKEN